MTQDVFSGAVAICVVITGAVVLQAIGPNWSHSVSLTCGGKYGGRRAPGRWAELVSLCLPLFQSVIQQIRPYNIYVHAIVLVRR